MSMFLGTPAHLGIPRKPVACVACQDGLVAPFDFTMAFQPIVDVQERSIFAYEALVRGRQQQSAGEMLGRVTPENMYAFDQSCRLRAIEMAADLGLAHKQASLSINFMPGAVYRPEACVRKTIETARRTGFPVERIIFEVTEHERIVDRGHLKAIFREYRQHGMQTAIDDFGAGYAGLTLLAEFQPDLVKIDRGLVTNIDSNPAARSIVGAMEQVCRGLGIVPIAEGVERAAEARVLTDLGIRYMQGYHFARPAFEALAQPVWEARSA